MFCLHRLLVCVVVVARVRQPEVSLVTLHVAHIYKTVQAGYIPHEGTLILNHSFVVSVLLVIFRCVGYIT